MTVTFDTWAWLEYFAASKRSERVKQVVEASDEICTSAISLLEIKAKFAREKQPYDEFLAFVCRRSRIVDVDKGIALDAAGHCERGLHTVDAVIYATAQSVRSTLLTGDVHFKGLPGVEML
ncbi:MAG: PIN domain-containing protein [Candidatus Micrarchaeota archaeon]